jgi:preprotein translocase subunit YajC
VFETLLSFAVPAQTAPQSAIPQYVMFGLIFLIIYFLMIRPHSKREKERKAMLSALKKNDKVVTQGGIHGTVTLVQDDQVILKVDPEKNVRLRVSRSAVQAILSSSGDARKGTNDKG